MRAMIQQVQHLMAQRGLPTKIINRFLRETNKSTPAVVRSLCREWLEELNKTEQLDCDENCLSCPGDKFFACILDD